MNGFFSWINSGTPEQQKKKQITAYALAAVAILLVISLLTLAIMGIVTSIKNKKLENEPEETVDPTRGYVTTTFAENQLHSGNLLMIDEAHPYVAEANSGVQTKKFGESRTKVDGNNIYYASNQYFDVNTDAMDALNKLVIDFYNNAKDSSGNLYNDTNIYLENIQYGNTFTFKYYATIKGENGAAETTFAKISENEKYQWIFDNAYKYGFVQLYSAPEANTAEGAETSEDNSHIFRYVGTVHSNLMKDKKCETLSEYLELLKTKTTFKTHFRVTVDKVTYETYYLAQGGELLIPEKYKNSYTVSGNNVDGYIVTVCTTTSK